LKQLNAPTVAIVTKTDLASRHQIAEQLLAVSQLAEYVEGRSGIGGGR